MYFVLAAIVLSVCAYFYRHFYQPHPLPALTNKVSQTVNFEAVVPIISEEEITLELDPDFEKEWEQYKPVLIEEADTVLLLEAEKLVSEVELIAASKIDVQNKLHELIPGFALLHKTKYYEPVNEFIAQTVLKECDLQLDEKQLAALWN
ncbi:MAG: hypothetical protein V4539_08680 [Bacteroidota bacterium]